MGVRFVIRKRDLGYHHWVLRDGICPNSETHDYDEVDWASSCTGRCDTFRYFSSAIATTASPEEA